MSTEPSKASFALSAFGDEIVVDFESQLQCLRNLNVGWLDLRAAWGVGVLHLDDEMVARVHHLCHHYGVKIACIGSPVGKSPIADPLEVELANLERIVRIAERIGTRMIRVFSFYPPKGTRESSYDAYLEESVSRLRRLLELAKRDGFRLVLENEKSIVGDRSGALPRAADRNRRRRSRFRVRHRQLRSSGRGATGRARLAPARPVRGARARQGRVPGGWQGVRGGGQARLPTALRWPIRAAGRG